VDLTLDRDPIMISSMDSEEAHKLLGEDLTDHSTVEERQDLLEELDHLPLAITQAVSVNAYLRPEFESQGSLGEYCNSDF